MTIPAFIMGLIAAIAPAYELPVNLIGAIIIKESECNPLAVHYNSDGSFDYGLMQLNSKNFPNADITSFTPFENIRYGCEIFSHYYNAYSLNYWQALIMYNCGPGRYFKGKPPNSSIQYANEVFAVWQSLEKYREVQSYGKP